MAKIENSMSQYMFKTGLVEMIHKFVKDDSEGLSKKDIDECAKYMENIIAEMVPSSEWNIRVLEEDSDTFDDFVTEHMNAIIGLLGIIVSFYFLNLKLMKQFRDHTE